MSCFGNLARGAAEVQMPNESNSGVVMHPKSKYERVERTAHVCFGAGAGSTASKFAQEASNAKRLDEFRRLVGQLRAACNGCHEKYMKTN